MMAFLDDFADPALVLLLLAAVAAAAAACGWWRGSLVWAATSLVTLATMVLLKLTLLANWLGTASPGLAQDAALRSPSGHTALAVLAYGGLARLLGLPRAAWIAAALLAGLLIGTLRVALSFHSTAESLVGGAVGLAGVLALDHWLGAPARPSTRWAILAVGLLVITAFHGSHLRVEHSLERAAQRVSQALGSERP